MQELKPCPFCGYGADLRWAYKDGQYQFYNGNGFARGKHYTIRCRKCRAKMEGTREKPLVDAWNRRADNG